MAATINGQVAQHQNIDLYSNGTGAAFRHRQFKSLKFEDAGEKEAVLDARGEIIGYVIKPRKPDGSVSMLHAEWVAWRDWLYQEAAKLATLLGRPCGPGQVEFTLIVSVGLTLATQVTRRLRVMVQKEAFDSTDNQDPIAPEIPLFVMDVTDEQGRRFIERGT